MGILYCGDDLTLAKISLHHNLVSCIGIPLCSGQMPPPLSPTLSQCHCSKGLCLTFWRMLLSRILFWSSNVHLTVDYRLCIVSSLLRVEVQVLCLQFSVFCNVPIPLYPGGNPLTPTHLQHFTVS